MSDDEEAMKAMEEVYDIMFANRYSDQDEEYRETVSKPIPDPPCLEGYFIRPRRNFDSRRGGEGGGPRGYGQDRQRWHGNQRGGNQDQGQSRYGYQGDRHRYGSDNRESYRNSGQGQWDHRGNRDGYKPDRHERREGPQNRYRPY